jgi:hypothetical protein
MEENTDGHDKNKRAAAPPVVSPSRPPAKRKKIGFVMKTLDEVMPKSLVTSNSEVYIESMRGYIDLIWFDRHNEEAFIDYLVKYFFPKSEDNRIHGSRAVQKKLGIISMCPRRVSRHDNAPQMKQPGKNDGGIPKFKKAYFVRYAPNGSDYKTRQQVVTELTQVC